MLHGVQHIYHPPVRLAHWPDGDERTRLVFIVKDIEKRQIEDLFKAFTDQISGARRLPYRQDAFAEQIGGAVPGQVPDWDPRILWSERLKWLNNLSGKP